MHKHRNKHTHFQVSISTTNKNKQSHTPKHTLSPRPFIEYPFSKWRPVVNNKHTDCLEAIKRPLCAFSSQLNYCNSSVPFKGVGVAHCIVCYHRVLFKESRSLNIRTKVPQGLADWGLPSLALIPNRGLKEGGNVWAETAGQVWRLMDMATWAIDGPRGSCWPNSSMPCDPGHLPGSTEQQRHLPGQGGGVWGRHGASSAPGYHWASVLHLYPSQLLYSNTHKHTSTHLPARRHLVETQRHPLPAQPPRALPLLPQAQDASSKAEPSR